MHNLTLSLEEEIHPDLAAEIEKQSVYVSPELRSLRIEPDRREVRLVFEGRDEEGLRGRVERFLEAMRRGFRALEQRTVFQNARKNQRPCETDVFNRLVACGWVVPLGPGQVALAGPALALANRIDATLARIGQQRFGGIERAYPTLIPSKALSRCGYLSSFPQHLSMVVHLREDFDTIEEFRRGNLNGEDLTIPNPTALERPSVCACPALCYHCYPTLAGQRLPPEGHVETAVGRIARYESSSMIGLDRLWEFTQRSIIWLGEDEFCLERRAWAIDAAARLAEDWDVECTIETASDPFFASVSTAKSFWQRAQDLKLELRTAVEPDVHGNPRTIAAASFNMHGTFFGHAFDIKDASGGPAYSACASWGLERWVLTIFTQHGLDPAAWPPALRI